MSGHAAKEVRRLLDAGPQPDEGFYRLKVTGLGETPWVNVTPVQLLQVMRVLDGDALGEFRRGYRAGQHAMRQEIEHAVAAIED